MKIKQVRNATLLVECGGSKFLVDPMLAEKGAYPGFEGTVNSHLSNPTVALTVPMSEITAVNAVIVTHTHPDHWDEAAKTLLPKGLPIFVQDARDAEIVRSSGFTDVRILTQESVFGDVNLVKTKGQHGSDAAYEAIGEILGNVCGVVFKHPSEKTLYLAGDTIWNDYVQETLTRHEPEVIILNAGDAQVTGVGSIIMGTKDVLAVHRAATEGTLIASHMEAVNHCVLTRAELREFAAANGFADSLCIPADGEAMTLTPIAGKAEAAR